MGALEALLGTRSIVICCGPGGVGKTTTAASIALAGAMAGKRACVVTIDPARRLADALDVEAVANTAHRIDGPFRGELYALMLDPKATFDELIDTNAADRAQAERIKSNRLYRNLVAALSGTQEYMATEKLYELYESRAFDLIVVDTPPTRFALDFLSAPSRLAGFLDNKIFRLLVTPGRAYLKAFSFATQVLLKTIAKVAGAEIVEDTIAFFQAFDGMQEGFKQRAASVEVLLEGEKTGFVLIATPQRDSIDQARFFAERLQENAHRIDALIINKVIPHFDDTLLSLIGPIDKESALSELASNLVVLSRESRREDALLSQVRNAVGQAPMLAVPLLDGDVHDLATLEVLVRHLLEGEVP